jgi:Alginate lyase
MNRKMVKSYLLLLLLSGFIFSCGEKFPEKDIAGWDFSHISSVKKEIADKDTGSYYYAAYIKLLEDADDALGKGPYSVTFKDLVPPGGTKHDYMSQGPYWWPDTTKPDGLPFIRRDGVTNPAAGINRSQYGSLVSSTRALTLAWYFTGEKKYAAKAAYLIRVWFLDSATLMNPHLEYAQSIPGITKGRGIGIIDFRGMYTLVDAITLLNCSGELKEAEMEQITKWFSDFFIWLTTSKNGIDEDKARNNHSVAYDVIATSIARFLGNDEYAVKKLSEMRTRRIDTMIEADGSQPEELARTNGWGYSVMNLNQFFDAGEMGLDAGQNIFEYRNPKGASVRDALDFLIGYIGKTDEWKWQQIGGWEGPENRLGLMIRSAARYYKDPVYDMLWNEKFYEKMKSDWSLLVSPGLD